jgi:hypothetical protein
MTAPSAYEDTYGENKVLYRRETVNGTAIYVYSNNPSDVLYNVTFTNMGAGNGNYVVSATASVKKIYEYVAPLNGVPQGSYEPVSKAYSSGQNTDSNRYGKLPSRRKNTGKRRGSR